MLFQSQYLLIPRIARRALQAARLLAAFSLLMVATQPMAQAASYVYFAFAVAALFVPRLERPPLHRLALAADTLIPFLGNWTNDALHSQLLLLWFFYLACTLVLLHDWIETSASVVLWVAIAAGLHKLNITSELFVGLLALVATSLKTQFESRIHKMSRQSVLYRAEALSARDEERERIANDFHDGPLQSFMSLQMRLEVARRMLQKDHGKGMGEIEELQAFWQSQVDSLRNFVHVIRASSAPPTDLRSALTFLAQAFEKESGVKVDYQCNADLSRLGPGPATEVLHLVREALHNVQKHAHAKTVNLTIGEASGATEITVKDDGEGYPFQGKFTLEELDAMDRGPASIRKRVHNLDGGLKLETTKGQGSVLSVRVPV